MSLASNIVKYRKKNHLSQEELSQSLNISRQSVSKWENGDNLPSIDNLISLSGLLDISLDELITGEPYLHFPYNYGKPKTRWPIFWLVLVVLLGVVVFSVFRNFYAPIIGGLLTYVMFVTFNPFDYKRYYTYWTLDKKGISYITNSKDVYSNLDDILIPIKTLIGKRKTQFVSYKDMKQIEVKLDLLKVDPNKVNAPGGAYASRQGQYMHEPFYLAITTTKDEKFYLDLRQYYWKNSSERQMLSTILMFLKRKNVEFVDTEDISNLSTDRDLILTNELYKLRDQEE